MNGVGGAFRSNEMDYWGKSYRETTSYINQVAPPNARIIVFGAPHLVETYARKDLIIERYKKEMEIDHTIQNQLIGHFDRGLAPRISRHYSNIRPSTQ